MGRKMDLKINILQIKIIDRLNLHNLSIIFYYFHSITAYNTFIYYYEP